MRGASVVAVIGTGRRSSIDPDYSPGGRRAPAGWYHRPAAARPGAGVRGRSALPDDPYGGLRRLVRAGARPADGRAVPAAAPARHAELAAESAARDPQLRPDGSG